MAGGKMKLVSIIIPVYNGEKYLQKSIDSIITQTYKDLEIIIVDDGSTDRTAVICEQYKKIDGRVKVIHKENGGIISAKKAGLKLAHGEYVTFVDGDDWIEKNMIEEMVNIQEKTGSDIVITGCVMEFDNNDHLIVRSDINPGYYEKDELINKIYPKMLYYGGFYRFGILQYAWSKLYKLNDTIRIMNTLDERVNNGEDVLFVYPALLDANSIYLSDKCFYHYRIHGESITNRKQTKDYFEETARLYLNLLANFKKSDHFPILIDQVNMYFCYMVWLGARRLSMNAFRDNFTYLFPFEEIERNSRIVLYGAGNVGKTYYNQLKMINYPVEIIWVDKNYKNLKSSDMNVTDPNIIFEEKADKIIIAIENESMASEVINYLKNKGIPENNIVWKIYKI